MAPQLNIPAGNVACKLYLLDTGVDMFCVSEGLMQPHNPGHEYINLPDHAWLIVNERTNEHIIFDLSLRKDYDESTPVIKNIIAKSLPGLQVKTDVPTLLTQNGITLDSISAAVLSHWHFDHTGDLSLFPKSVKAIVGPGWKETFGNFYPLNPEGLYHDYEFEGREIVQLEKEDFGVKVAGFTAYDYFGDGSFFLLHTPGHTAEHMTALVRTTTAGGEEKEDSFVLLGADSCHFMGMLRPTQDKPLTESAVGHEEFHRFNTFPAPCSCVPPRAGADKREVPFYEPSEAEGTYYLDQAQAVDSISKLQALDAHSNVLMTIAHDPATREVLPSLSKGDTLDDWKEKGYKEAMEWRFLEHLPRDGKPSMPPSIDGQYLHGVKVRSVLP